MDIIGYDYAEGVNQSLDSFPEEQVIGKIINDYISVMILYTKYIFSNIFARLIVIIDILDIGACK